MLRMCLDMTVSIIVSYRGMGNEPFYIYSKLHTFLLNGETNISGIFLLQ